MRMDQKAETLLSYWRSLIAEPDIPDRADFDPIEVSKLLPFLFMLDVEPCGRLKIRLMGTELAQRLGADGTGKYVDELISGAYLDRMNEMFALAISQRQPVHSASRYQVPDREHIFVERLLLPLTNGSDAVDIILSIQSFSSAIDPSAEPFLSVLNTIPEHATETVSTVVS